MIFVCCVARGETEEGYLKKKKNKPRCRYAAKEIRFASSLWLLTQHLSYGCSFLNLLDFA